MVAYVRGPNGKRHRDTFATKREAEAFIDALRMQGVYRKAGLKLPFGNVTLKELFAKRLTRITNKKEIIRATRVFRLFEEIFDFPPAVPEVRSVHIQTFINTRLETGVKPETVNREVTIISAAVKLASTMFPEQLEFYEPPRIARPPFNRRKRKKRIITEGEKDRIVQAIYNDRLKQERRERTASRPNVARMFEVAWFLGLRFSEVDRLLATDFRAEERSLRVVRWKTGTVDLLEFLPDRVIELLIDAESKTERIFDRHCSEHTFAEIIKRSCESSGIKYGRSEIDGVTFHSTRHSFTTRMMRVTDMATTQSYTGHSNAEMVAHYSHADPESRRRAMERLYGGNFLKEIFEKVQSGNMSFSEFKAALK